MRNVQSPLNKSQRDVHAVMVAAKVLQQPKTEAVLTLLCLRHHRRHPERKSDTEADMGATSSLRNPSSTSPPKIDTSVSGTRTNLPNSHEQVNLSKPRTAPHRLTAASNDPRNQPPIKKRSSTIGPGSGKNFSNERAQDRNRTPRKSRLTPAASSRRVRSADRGKKPRRRSRRYSESLTPVNEKEVGRLNNFRDKFRNRQRHRGGSQSSGNAGAFIGAGNINSKSSANEDTDRYSGDKKVSI